MARLATAGAEFWYGSTNANKDLLEGVTTTSTAAQETTITHDRSLVSWKCTGTNGDWVQLNSPTQTLGRAYFYRLYGYITAWPSTPQSIMFLNGPTGTSIDVDSTGLAQARVAGTLQGPTVQLALNTWHCFQIKMVIGTGSVDAFEGWVDDMALYSASGISISDTLVTSMAGGASGSWGAGKINYIDDMAINDDQGLNCNSFCGEGTVVGLVPDADSSITNWVAGAGGTSALYAGVDNLPPVGVTAANKTNTSQIYSSSSTGTANYIASFGTGWKTARRPLALWRVCQGVIVHGEDASTGTKTGTWQITSPVTGTIDSVSAGGTNQFGPTAGGAVGTYPTNWAIQRGTVAYATTEGTRSAYMSTAPLMKVTKTDTGTRLADICFMGILVEFLPDPVDGMLYLEGFEDQTDPDVNGWQVNTIFYGTSSANTDIVEGRNGGHALRCHPSGAAGQFHVAWGPDAMGQPAYSINFYQARDSLYLTAYFKIDVLPSSDLWFFAWGSFDAVPMEWKLKLTTGGALQAWYLNGSNVDTQITGTVTPSLGVWHSLQVEIANHNTAGGSSFRTLIDSVEMANGTSLTRNLSTTIKICGQPVFNGHADGINAANNTYDITWDDIIGRWDAAPGLGTCRLLLPNAAGTYQEWTLGTNAKDYNEVNEVPILQTTYLESNTALQRLSYNLQSCDDARVAGTIQAIKAVWWLVNTAGSQYPQCEFGYLSGSNYRRIERVAILGSTNRWLFSRLAPGRTPWTRTLIDALQLYTKIVSAGTTSGPRVHWNGVMLWEDEVPAAPPQTMEIPRVPHRNAVQRASVW